MVSTIFASCIGGLIAIAIAVWYHKKKGKSVDGQGNLIKEDMPVKSVKSGEELSKEALTGLLHVNVFVRTNAVPVEVLNLVEKTIDNLKAATPQMIERHPDHDLTYELKEICNKHLLSQLKEFFDMSAKNRDKYMPNLMERLNEIADLIERVKDIVETDEVTEMKVIAGFLETKYSRPMGT